MQCNKCGHELVDGSEFCGNCGAKIVNSTAMNQNSNNQPTPPMEPQATATPSSTPIGVSNQNPTQVPQQATTPANSTVAVPRQPKNGLSIASMVLGIIALLSVLLWFIAMPLGIAALVLGIIGRNKGAKGMAIAGIVTGALAIAGTIVVYAFVFSYMAKLCGENPNHEKCKELNSSQSLNNTMSSLKAL